MNKDKSKIYDVEEFENIRDIIKDVTKRYPDNNAFIIKKKENNEIKYENITYTRFLNEINYLGTALIDLGLKGKRIAVIGQNSYEWELGYLATVNGTGISVPLDKGLPEEEIELSLKRSYSDAIIFDEKYEDIIENIKQKNNTNVTKYICMKELKGFINIKELIEKGKELVEKGNDEFINAKIDNDEMSIILFTSGTTALSKAVMLSHRNVASNVYGLNSAEKIYPTDVNLAFLPLHHTFGSTGLLFFLSNGATNVFCDGIRYIQQNLKEYKVSVFVCVPLLLESMYKKIMNEVEKQGKTKLIKKAIKVSNFLLKFKIDIRKILFKDILNNLGGHLRFIVSGASAIDEKVAKGFNDFGMLTVQGYGLTESAPTLTAENEYNIKYGSIGYPLTNVKLKIENPDEKGIGEVVATGPNIMLGYYENEEATNEIIKIDENNQRWLHTGDLGYQDKDGYVFIAGRKKNVIVLKNGKNVFPEELELLVNNLPYVQESMVFGMPKNEDLVVSVKIVYDKEYINDKYKSISKEELEKIIWEDIKNINSKLTTYKHMKNLIITDEPMIKTTTAKVKRYEEIANIMKNN